MRILALLTFLGLVPVLSSCSESKASQAPQAKKAAAPKPRDESFRFPKENLVETKVVDKELMGKAFMPGGTMAHYKKGKVEYEMFVSELATPLQAAILLPDWSRALTDSKLVPAFSGYFGIDGDRPMFVFIKGSWITGVLGLPQKEADVEARVLAAALP